MRERARIASITRTEDTPHERPFLLMPGELDPGTVPRIPDYAKWLSGAFAKSRSAGIIARSDGTYDATAEVPTKALLLDAATLMELLEDHFSLLHATLVYAAERFLSIPLDPIARSGGTRSPVPEYPIADRSEATREVRVISA